jgi:hypothetical protein
LVTLDLLPGSNHSDDGVGREPSVHKLADEIELGNESGLQDNGDVAGIEELDGVRSSGTSLVLVLNGKIDTETLWSLRHVK